MKIFDVFNFEYFIFAGPEIRAVGLQSCHIHDCVPACSEGSDAARAAGFAGTPGE